MAPSLRSLGPNLPASLRRLNQSVANSLDQGQALPDALRKAGAPLTRSDFLALDWANEAARLDEVLAELASSMEEERRWRREAITSLLYPALVIHLAGILPTLPLGMNYGWTASLLYLLAALGPLYLITGAILLLRKFVRSGPSPAAERIDRLRLKLPLLGYAWHHQAAARFCSIFYSGLRSGARMDDLLRAAGAASRNLWIQTWFDQTADHIDQFGSPAEIFIQCPALPQTTTALLTTGGHSGSLDTLTRSAMDQANETALFSWKKVRFALIAIAYLWAVGLVLAALAAILGPYYLLLYQLLDQ